MLSVFDLTSRVSFGMPQTPVSYLPTLLLLLLLYIYYYMCECAQAHTCHSTCVEIRGQLEGAGSPTFWEVELVFQARWLYPLEPAI